MSMFNDQLTVNPNFYLAKVDRSTRARPSSSASTTRARSTWPGRDAGARPVRSGRHKLQGLEVREPHGLAAYQVITYTPCSIPTTNSTGGALYNGQLLTIDIRFPITYWCRVCWWKIRYNLGASPTGSPADTTTWSAAIKGDPVHLVNE